MRNIYCVVVYSGCLHLFDSISFREVATIQAIRKQWESPDSLAVVITVIRNAASLSACQIIISEYVTYYPVPESFAISDDHLTSSDQC